MARPSRGCREDPEADRVGPHPMKILCHSETLMLKIVSRGMPTPDHNDPSYF